MSKLRPTLVDALNEPSLGYAETYFRVLEAVKSRRALAHGRLDVGPLSCAIGAYFKESTIAISAKAIDEITAYNDSFPKLTPMQRWSKVYAWLRVKTKSIPQ